MRAPYRYLQKETMEIIFSDIDHDDIVECSELFTSIFKKPPWNENWDIENAFERLNDIFNSPKTIAIKAKSENRIIGFLMGEIQQWEKNKVFYLKEMCVTTSVQRQGVGKAMIVKLENKLIGKKVGEIYLITHRESIPSEFYSSLAFKENPNIMVMGKTIEENR